MIKIKFLFQLPFVIPSNKNFNFKLSIKNQEYQFSLKNNYYLFYIPEINVKGIGNRKFFVESNRVYQEFKKMHFIDKEVTKIDDITKKFYHEKSPSIIEYIVKESTQKLKEYNPNKEMNILIKEFYNNHIHKEYNKLFINGFNYFINCYRDIIPIKHKWVTENLAPWNFYNYSVKLYDNNRLIKATNWSNNYAPTFVKKIFYHTEKFKDNEIRKLRIILNKNRSISEEKKLINNAYSILQRGFYKSALLDAFTSVEIKVNKIINKLNPKIFLDISKNYNKSLFKKLGRNIISIEDKINIIFEYYNIKEKKFNILFYNKEILTQVHLLFVLFNKKTIKK